MSVPAGTTRSDSTPINRNRKWLPLPSSRKLCGTRSSMTNRQRRPSLTAADSVIRQWLLCGAPQVISVSAPWRQRVGDEELELAGLVAARKQAELVVALDPDLGPMPARALGAPAPP